jgi:AraC-like DNA-binding protein
MNISWHSDDLPPRDRFSTWYEITKNTHVPTEIRCLDETEFRASMRIVPVGAVQVSELTYPSLVATRNAKLVRQGDPELYMLTLSRRGQMLIRQAGREAVMNPHEMVLYHTSQPFQGRVSTTHDQCEVIQTQIPRNLVPLPDGDVDNIVATTISTTRGAGALLAQCLTGITDHAEACHPLAATDLSGVVADLLAVLVNDRTGDDSRRVADSRYRTLFLAIRAYIESHLQDPDLSVWRLAVTHHLSVRSLQRLFGDQGISITEWIRRRRLERCCRDLRNPLLADRPIGSIAAKWQFPSHAHFTRLFRKAYGVSPGEYRQLHLAKR